MPPLPSPRVIAAAAALALPTALASQPDPRDTALAQRIAADRAQIARDLVQLGAIVAPSGREQDRARWVAGQFRRLGLVDVRIDSLFNVEGRLPGTLPEADRRTWAFVSTLDDLATVAQHQRAAGRPPRIDGDRVAGPGTHTSSTTAAMLGAIRALRATGVRPAHDLLFAAVAQEETGLTGMKAAYPRWRPRLAGVVDILGDGRSITYGALAIHWWQLWGFRPGGHSLSGGLPNVNQGIARAVDRLLALPQAPAERTVLNISMLRSGDVVNRKPDSAWCSVDVRSPDPARLAALEAAARAVVDSVARETGTRFEWRVLQRTDGGQLAGADTTRLVRTAVAIARDLGLTPTLGNAGSSNMNVPLAGGTPAIGLGGERGGRRGEPGEFADIPAMLRTATMVARLARAMGGTM
jgi:acetylornithine deacetylase/succinyl-diaminopimelate desuccinylase-like protein